MKSIIAHPSFTKELDLAALGQHFVTGYILDSQTIFRKVSKLTPGHYLTIDRSGMLKIHRYWNLNRVKRGSFRGSLEEATEQLERLLENAFTYRLISDVPVGLFLSGGIDSSLLSAILKKRAEVDILNITIGFQERHYDESPKARMVSEELGTKHIVHYIDETEVQDLLLKFCEIYDEPFGDTSGIPTYILSRLARQHVKVALSADGGDEQFCGYENYASYLRNYGTIKRIPLVLRMIMSRFLQDIVPYRLLLSFKTSLPDGESYSPQAIARYEKMLKLLRVRDETDLIRLMNEKAWSQETVGNFFKFNDEELFKNTVLSSECLENFKGGLMDSMMRTDYTAFLRDDILVKVDRASMFVSLECRDPFLDHRIAEFAYSLPVSFVYENREHKKILKKILRQWISENVISSPKRGFIIPLYYWLRGVWKPFVLEYLSAEKVRKIGVLDEKKVNKELDRFYRYHGYRAEKIWMMLNFQMWAERWYLSN
jgi:asparagine synthase (glutamine-hydrolysing)